MMSVRINMLRPLRSSRWVSNYYNLFPKTFPTQKPQWDINLNTLRKEYRSLQQKIHPDLNHTDIENVHDIKDDTHSSQLNKAYETLRDPLLRSQYILKLTQNVDLTDDNTVLESRDPELLVNIMEVYEEISEVTEEDELKPIKKQVEETISKIKKDILQSFNDMNYPNAITSTIALKYWTNVLQSIKNWSPDQRIELHH